MRQMIVTYTDGKRSVTRRERDDQHGRHLIEKAAFAEIARGEVAYVTTEVVERYAGGTKGAYR